MTHDQAIKLLRAIRDLALLPYPVPDDAPAAPEISLVLGEIAGLCNRALGADSDDEDSIWRITPAGRAWLAAREREDGTA